ncbi:hypothetical protein [Streptomyces flaveus]
MRGGFSGPTFADELIALIIPKPAPKGPRRAITHLGIIEVPADAYEYLA